MPSSISLFRNSWIDTHPNGVRHSLNRIDNGYGKVAAIADGHTHIGNGAPDNRVNLLPTTDKEFVDVKLEDFTKL